MKVITWNIWGGKHIDKVIEQLKHEQPDIITLQEVKEQEGKNNATLIGERLGYYVTYCKSFTTDRHNPSYDIGNAILTKTKPSSTRCHILSDLASYEGSSKTEPRTAVEVTLLDQEKTVTVVTTHLGYSDYFGESNIRMTQFEKLKSILSDKQHLILTGDFNSLPTSLVVTELEKIMVNTDSKKEDTSYTDMKDPKKTPYRIDYIFTSPDIRCNSFEVLSTEASDHNPLSSELSL